MVFYGALLVYDTPVVLRIKKSRTLFAITLFLKVAILLYGVMYTVLINKGWAKARVVSASAFSFFTPTQYDPGSVFDKGKYPEHARALIRSGKLPYCPPNVHSTDSPRYQYLRACWGGGPLSETCKGILNICTGCRNLMAGYNNISCAPLYSRYRRLQNAVYVPMAVTSFPFTCVNGTFPGPQCAREYNVSAYYMTYYAGVEKLPVAYQASVTDGVHLVPSFSMPWEAVDKNGDVLRYNYDTAHAKPFPPLQVFLDASGVDLDATNPTWEEMGFGQGMDSSYRASGFLIAYEIEVYNLKPPSSPYNGKLSPGWFDFDDSPTNWKYKVTTTHMLRQFSNHFVDDAHSASHIVTEGGIVMSVKGLVYEYDTVTLIQTLTSMIVLFGVSNAIVDTLAPYIIPEFEQKKYQSHHAHENHSEEDDAEHMSKDAVENGSEMDVFTVPDELHVPNNDTHEINGVDRKQKASSASSRTKDRTVVVKL